MHSLCTKWQGNYTIHFWPEELYKGLQDISMNSRGFRLHIHSNIPTENLYFFLLWFCHFFVIQPWKSGLFLICLFQLKIRLLLSIHFYIGFHLYNLFILNIFHLIILNSLILFRIPKNVFYLKSAVLKFVTFTIYLWCIFPKHPHLFSY